MSPRCSSSGHHLREHDRRARTASPAPRTLPAVASPQGPWRAVDEVDAALVDLQALGRCRRPPRSGRAGVFWYDGRCVDAVAYGQRVAAGLLAQLARRAPRARSSDHAADEALRSRSSARRSTGGDRISGERRRFTWSRPASRRPVSAPVRRYARARARVGDTIGGRRVGRSCTGRAGGTRCNVDARPSRSRRSNSPHEPPLLESTIPVATCRARGPARSRTARCRGRSRGLVAVSPVRCDVHRPEPARSSTSATTSRRRGMSRTLSR